jgi:succinate-acetate transporter protein
MSAPATPTAPSAPFGEPTPLGLLGLAIGCAALVPVAFGWLPTDPTKLPMFFKTAAVFCLLFGGGGQFLAGLMSLANKNTLGGTLLTTFSFNWVVNWWVLDEASQGRAVDSSVVLAVDVAFILIFLVLTYAFGFFSKLLFVFLVDIDLLYVLRIARHFATAGSDGWKLLGTGVGLATIALTAIALYISFALLVNPAAGRAVFPSAGPMFKPTPPPVA